MPLHRAHPLLLLGGAFALGIWAADVWRWPGLGAPPLLALAASLCAIAWVLRRDALATWCALCLAFGMFGAARMAAETQATLGNASLIAHGRSVTIEALLLDEPDVRDGITRIIIQPERLSVDGFQPLMARSDQVLVRMQDAPPLAYGMRLRISGRIDAPPRLPEFDYRQYLRRKDVLSWIAQPDSVEVLAHDQGSPFWSALFRIKTGARDAIKAAIPGMEGALLTGILLGDDNGLSRQIQDQFRATGTSHIVAISGYNLSIIAGVILLLLGRVLNRRRAALLSLGLIWLYALFVGASASVLRAAWMASITLLGLAIFRTGVPLNSLAAAGLAMLIATPNTLFDGGFQLSAAATAGLVLFADRLQKQPTAWLEAHVPQRAFRTPLQVVLDAVWVTLAAQLTTLPILVANFGAISPVLFAANALALPLQPFVMGFGALAALVAAVQPALGAVLGWLAWVPLTLTLRIVAFFAGLPNASIRVPEIGVLLALAYYLVLTVVSLRLIGTWRTPLRPRHAFAPAIALGALAFGVWFYQRPDGQLHITFGGKAALLQSPQGQFVGFGDPADVAMLAQRALPAWRWDLDAMVLPVTNAQTDEASRRLLRSYSVGSWLAPATANVPEYAALPKKYIVIDGEKRLDGLTGMTMTLTPHASYALHASVQFGEMVFVLLGEGDVPADRNFAANLIFASPRARNSVASIRRLPNATVVWADTGVAPNEPVRAISLRNVNYVSVTSTETQFQLDP